MYKKDICSNYINVLCFTLPRYPTIEGPTEKLLC